MKRTISVIALILFFFVNFQLDIFAQKYGEGKYGSGDYNVGEPTATSVPTVTSSNNNSNNTSNNSAPSCNDATPSSAPKLFQIDLTSTTATLSFVPAISPLTYYYIAFGRNINNMEYGTQFNSTVYSGVQKVTVNALKPNTKYYFKIRAGNGCKPGPWSDSIFVRTSSTSKSPKRIYYSVSQKVPDTVFIAQITPQKPSKTTPKIKIPTSLTTTAIPIIAPPYRQITPTPVPLTASSSVRSNIFKRFFSAILNKFK